MVCKEQSALHTGQLFEIIAGIKCVLSAGFNKASTIFTSQLPLEQWYDVFEDKTVADAICDRIFHNAHKIKLDGDSMRGKR